MKVLRALDNLKGITTHLQTSFGVGACFPFLSHIHPCLVLSIPKVNLRENLKTMELILHVIKVRDRMSTIDGDVVIGLIISTHSHNAIIFCSFWD